MIIMIILGTIMLLGFAIPIIAYLITETQYNRQVQKNEFFARTHYNRCWDALNAYIVESDRMDEYCMLNHNLWKRYRRRWDITDVKTMVLVGVGIVGLIGLLICSGIAISAKIKTDNNNAYDMYNTQYMVLEYRLTSEENPLSNLDLYLAVTEYNNTVISQQKDCQNPFINIFCDRSVEDCKIFDLEKD